METPKKPLKKSTASTKTNGAKKATEKLADSKAKNRFDDDDDDDDFGIPLDDDFSKYESFENFKDDDDY